MSPTTSATDRLQLLYELSRRLPTLRDADELASAAARGARELLDAEGCSILIHDATRNELTFRVVSQRQGQESLGESLRSVHIPTTQGIAGWAFTHDEVVFAPDVARDARFFSGVDTQTGLTTTCVVAAPLRSHAGNIGVIEVINPTGIMPERETCQFLETLAGDIAVAYETSALYNRLRGETMSLRQMFRLIGMVAVGFGLVTILGAALANAVVAGSLGDLLRRPALWTGGGLAATGLLFLAVGRGRLVPRSE